MKTKPVIKPPDWTQAPNVFFDKLLPLLTGAETKICCIVIRETFGWHLKAANKHNLSLSYLEKAAGLARHTVITALDSLLKPAIQRPAILGRNKKKNRSFSYYLLIDTSKSVESDSAKTAPSNSNLMVQKHGQQIVQKHGHPSCLRKKEERKVSLSSSSAPNMSSAEKTQDDESKALTQVVFWFEELSKGSAWNWNRDGKAYDQVKHLAPGFILMGICYSVSKCPSHKLSTFAYCLPAIRDYAEQLIVNADDALQLALRERKKVLKMAKLGKWTVPEMSEEEFKSVMRESRAGD